MSELTFLGTGTSQGIPLIGCHCPVCRSSDPRDKRLRAAALVRHGGKTILIDAGPDFRTQMLGRAVTHLDGILLTHNHKDHTGGLDDVRALNYVDRKAVDIYCEDRVLKSLQAEYAYAFAKKKYPGSPEWHIHRIGETPFRLAPCDEGVLEWIHDKGYFYRRYDGSLVPSDNAVHPAPAVDSAAEEAIIPIRGYHDAMPVLGFRFGPIAYLTDMSRLPESEQDKLHGLKHLTLNTVGYKPHHSHFSLDEALVLAGSIGAEHTWLTHLSHSFPCHEAFCREIEQRCGELGVTASVRPAYDGLTIR